MKECHVVELPFVKKYTSDPQTWRLCHLESFFKERLQVSTPRVSYWGGLGWGLGIRISNEVLIYVDAICLGLHFEND